MRALSFPSVSNLDQRSRFLVNKKVSAIAETFYFTSKALTHSFRASTDSACSG